MTTRREWKAEVQIAKIITDSPLLGNKEAGRMTKLTVKAKPGRETRLLIVCFIRQHEHRVPHQHKPD